MIPNSDQEARACLTRLLGEDPAGLEWPRGFSVSTGRGDLAAVFDPHNALVTVYGAEPRDFQGPDLGLLSAASGSCSRVLVLTGPDAGGDWPGCGFVREGTISGYWADGGAAELWTRTSADRLGTAPVVPPITVRGGPRCLLPSGWLCRPAEVPDAGAIGSLLRRVFPDYPIPDDPGTIRFALASGAVHSRLVCRPDGSLAACASVEFQPGDGAVEITDCATAPVARGRGLMTHLVGCLEADLTDVFDDRGAYCLAREDQPAMQRVLAGRGWRLTGRLVNHFREGRCWLSAGVWCL